MSKPTTNVLREDCTNALTATNGDVKLFIIETPPQSLVAGLQSTDKPSDEIAPRGQDTAVFGLPAVTNPAGSLKERHILWTPVISAGEKLPLPLDSCCSVSLVSRSHADLVASKCPKLKYQSLENPIAVSISDSQSQLKAIGTMEIPIQWNNGKESTFQMLIVPGLPWPVLFGENHLHATQALVDHAEPSIHFRHPSMSFKIACSLQNPLKAHGCSSNTHAGVTCLLTGPSFPGYSPGDSKLNRGLNFVSVCLTVGTALMAFSPSDLWVDGQDIQPGVKVLSGPFHMTAATDQLVPAKSCHASVVNIPETSCESSFVQHISDPQPVYTTTLAIECKCEQADIPQNIIGQCRKKTLKFMKMQHRIQHLFSLKAGCHGQMDNKYCHLHLPCSLHQTFLQLKPGSYLNNRKN